MAAKKKLEKATFAAGCFWHVEEAFRTLKGVKETTVGYTGGWMEGPNYQEVCTDKTGHAEAVEVAFEPDTISYERLLDVFWSTHDPTTLNRQGPDFGTQYRSAIFYHTEEQKKLAETSKKNAQKKFKNLIVTEIIKAGKFYKAEEYHQKYLMKRGAKTCF
jgi:peptide-methionine (S)-S-oxide reductase